LPRITATRKKSKCLVSGASNLPFALASLFFPPTTAVPCRLRAENVSEFRDQEIPRRRLGGLFLQGEVHALVTAKATPEICRPLVSLKSETRLGFQDE